MWPKKWCVLLYLKQGIWPTNGHLQYSSQAPLSASFYTPKTIYAELGDHTGTSSATTKRAASSSNPFQINGHKSFPLEQSDPESSSETVINSARSMQKSKSSISRRQEDAESPNAAQYTKSIRAQTQKASAPKVPTHHEHSRSERPASPIRVSHQEVVSQPRQHVIRRVTATFQIPVKEEEFDADGIDAEDSASASASLEASSSAEPSPTTELAPIRIINSVRNKKRRKRIVPADDDDSYVEEDAADNAGSAMGARESVSEEEDDELMMGAEVSCYLFSLHYSLSYEALYEPRTTAEKCMVHGVWLTRLNTIAAPQNLAVLRVKSARSLLVVQQGGARARQGGYKKLPCS